MESGAALSGRVLRGAYVVLDLIGEGGMGCVYRAQQLALDRVVAVKLIRSNVRRDASSTRRFRIEAQAVQGLSHPNTVRVFDFGETEDGLLYLVMEYLDGITLNDVIEQQGPLGIDEVSVIGAQVLKSLMEAHGQGIIHHDIKPANLMLCSQVGVANFVKVLDFGVARIQSKRAARPTHTQDLIGTPWFMSPEQLRNKPCDARSDLYALGHTLFALATGQCLYEGEAVEAAMQHVSPVEATIPGWLRNSTLGEVIARAIRKRPEARFPSAKAMLRDLTGERLTGSKQALPVLRIQPSGEVVGLKSRREPESSAGTLTAGAVQIPVEARFGGERLDEEALNDLERQTTVAAPSSFVRRPAWGRWTAPLLLGLGLAVGLNVMMVVDGGPGDQSAIPAPVVAPIAPATAFAERAVHPSAESASVAVESPPVATKPPPVGPLWGQNEGVSEMSSASLPPGDSVTPVDTDEARVEVTSESRRSRRTRRPPASEPDERRSSASETLIPLF